MTGMADKWDRIYANNTPPGDCAWLLQQHDELLPKKGRALDIACGTGANSLFLARRGLTVSSWDISPVAIKQLNDTAVAQNLDIQSSVRNIQAEDFPVNHFDLVINFHYLDRSIIPAMKASLAREGVLVFQTFVAGKIAHVGPSNPAYLLAEGELEQLMGGLDILASGNGQAIIDELDPIAGRDWVIARAN